MQKVYVYTIIDDEGTLLFIHAYSNRKDAEWDRNNDITRDNFLGMSCVREYEIHELVIDGTEA